MTNLGKAYLSGCSSGFYESAHGSVLRTVGHPERGSPRSAGGEAERESHGLPLHPQRMRTLCQINPSRDFGLCRDFCTLRASQWFP